MAQKELSAITLKFRDKEEEKEYNRIKSPLLDICFMWLFIFCALLFIPLTIRYFNKHLYPQSYLGLAFLGVAILILLLHKKLKKYLKLTSFTYISLILILYIVNMRKILDKQEPHEAFYMGYAFALTQRMLDARINGYLSVVLFNIVFTAIKFALITIPDPAQAVLVVFVEVFPWILSYLGEKADKLLFDALYKSRHQLLNFKQFLTKYLPNPMAIVSNDYSVNLFVNNPFQNTFKCKDNDHVKESLQNLSIDQEALEKNRNLLDSLDYTNQTKKGILTLSQFLQFLLKKELPHQLKEAQLQVIQEEKIPDQSVIQRLSSQNDRTPKASVVDKLQSQSISTKTAFLQRNNSDALKLTTETRKSGTFDELQTDRPDLINIHKSSEGVTRKVWKVTLVPLLWDNYEAIAIILDDVTHERTIMELKIADKNKDLVISMISHELRTPLNVMLGTVDIVKQKFSKLNKEIESDISSYLDAFKTNSLLLLNLVNSILDFSRIKDKKLKLSYSEVNIDALLYKVKSLFDHTAQSKNLSLKVNIDQSITPTLVTDNERLSQILIYLLGNAFKFTYSGGITLNVTQHCQSPCTLKFSVQDTGVGMQVKDIDKLFKMFRGFDQDDRKVSSHGMGLGSTISNALAELLDSSEMNGIHVTSQPGQGSIFSFLVEDRRKEIMIQEESELDDIEEENEFNQEQDNLNCVYNKMAKYCLSSGGMKSLSSSRVRSRGATAGDNLKKRIGSEETEEAWCLIVDDNPFNLMVAQNIMEEKGYFVKTAMNGLEAVRKAQEHSQETKTFRVILMDCQMPVMNGYDATKCLRKMMRNCEICECPIVAVTANIKDEEHEKLAAEAGMDGYLSKPLQIDKLEKVLVEIKERERRDLTRH